MRAKRMRTTRQQLIEEPATLADRTANGAGADTEPARSLALEEDQIKRAKGHAVSLRQCALFASDAGVHIAKSMTDAADFLEALSSPDHADAGKPWYLTMPERDPFAAGFEARQAGIDEDENPFNSATDNARDWDAGWESADEEAENQLVQIALHLNCEPDADSILHVIREIQADLDIAKHADAGKVEGDELPQDVINLVIAAREVWEETDTLSYYHTDEDFSQRVEALDKALEPFGERVPYENDPDTLPSAPSEGAE